MGYGRVRVKDMVRALVEELSYDIYKELYVYPLEDETEDGETVARLEAIAREFVEEEA